MHSERQVHQLCLLLSRTGRKYLGHGALGMQNTVGMSCRKSQVCRFHVSADNMSPKFLPYMRNIMASVKSCCRVMSSAGPAGNGPAGNGPAGNGPAGNGPAGNGPAGNGPAHNGPAGNGPAGNGPAGNAPELPTSSATGDNKLQDGNIKEQITKNLFRVQPKSKMKLTAYTDNIQCSPERAMLDYLLESSDLFHLARVLKRSPYPEKETITMYYQRDVESMSIEKWGSLENMEKEKKRRRLIRNTSRPWSRLDSVPSVYPNASPTQSIWKDGQGRVVLFAAAVNLTNAGVKCVAWVFTGSHSMFSEFLHSTADTVNQLLLAFGIQQSLKQPDTEHPYGWMPFRNVTSLISGVAIFCLGAGISIHHGITGLSSPHEIQQPMWAIGTLLGALLSEGSSVMVALKHLTKSANQQGISLKEFVIRGHETNSNVVLLEDTAAIGGVLVALASIGFTYLGYPQADAIGSLLIGSILGGVAGFIIYTNAIILVGRSIHPEKKLKMINHLESDRFINSIHDVKATEMGGNFVRVKAEVSFDGEQITRYYLEQEQDIIKILQEVKSIDDPEEMEKFMLQHGSKIVDFLGGQIDRIEKDFMKTFPEVLHLDLEQL